MSILNSLRSKRKRLCFHTFDAIILTDDFLFRAVLNNPKQLLNAAIDLGFYPLLHLQMV